LESRDGVLDARDPMVAAALQLLMIVCTHGAREELWEPFGAAMARAEGVPLTLYLTSTAFADPVHAAPDALEALDSAIATLASESDPTQIVWIGQAATYVDRLEGCREALWRVVGDARQGGAVVSGITARLELVYDDIQTGHWDDAEQLANEAMEECRT